MLAATMGSKVDALLCASQITGQVLTAISTRTTGSSGCSVGSTNACAGPRVSVGGGTGGGAGSALGAAAMAQDEG